MSPILSRPIAVGLNLGGIESWSREIGRVIARNFPECAQLFQDRGLLASDTVIGCVHASACAHAQRLGLRATAAGASSWQYAEERD